MSKQSFLLGATLLLLPGRLLRAQPAPMPPIHETLGCFALVRTLPPGHPQPPVPPLFVVDGFWFPPGTQESFFTPQEIQAAGVYKDGAAMRQRYGPAAADGVLELTLSTPFLLGNQLLRTSRDKARARRRLVAPEVQAVRRLSVDESKPYVGRAGQAVLVLTLAQ